MCLGHASSETGRAWKRPLEEQDEILDRLHASSNGSFMVFSKLGRNHLKTARLGTLNLRIFVLRACQIFNFCTLLDEKVKIQNKAKQMEPVYYFVFFLDK